jgi:ABC-type Fe3+ transport system permease subunit
MRSWSALKAIERVVAAPYEFRGEFWLSTSIGATAATAAVALALPLAWSLRTRMVATTARTLTARRRFVVSTILLIAIALLLTIPGPLLGLGIIRTLDRPATSSLGFLGDLYDSNFAPWFAQTLRALPIALLILLPALSSIPQPMLDAAATEGSGWWGQLFRIAIPQRLAAIAAAWLIALAIAVGELAATVLVMPPQRGATALSIQVFQLLHYGVDDRVAAICLFMVITIAALTGIAAALLRRRVHP